MLEFSPEIVRQFVLGDEPSFKVIFNFFYPRLYHFIREYIPNDDLAENIVQDTFLVLWNKRNELSEDSNINAWLYTVAKNNCLKELRDDRSRRFTQLSEQLGDLELKMNADALDVLDTSELTFSEIDRIIRSTLDVLPPQCRKVFEMSRFQNKKNKEIADELNISVKAVEGQITKALKVFRNTLGDYLPLVAYLFMI